MQKPMGPEDLDCPWWKEAMSKRCHKCPMWTQIRGTNPQTGADVDTWNCALAMMPMIGLEIAHRVQQGTASVDEVRKEIVAAQQPASVKVIRQMPRRPVLIEDNSHG